MEFRSSECALESALRNCFGDTPLEIFELEQQLQREGGGGGGGSSSSSGRGGRSRRRLKQAQTRAGASGDGGGVDRYNPTKNGGGASEGNNPHSNGGGGGRGSVADRTVDRSSGSDNAASEPEPLDWFPSAGEGTFLWKVPSKLSQGAFVHQIQTYIHTYIPFSFSCFHSSDIMHESL
jgi:hypothetical protein